MSDSLPEQPTLTDGEVTLRPWRDEDIEAAIAGHDAEIAHWFGFAEVTPSYDGHHAAVERWRAAYRDGRAVVNFVIEHGGAVAGSCEVRRAGDGVGELSWTLYAGHRGRGLATRAVRMLADYALTETGQGGLGLGRVEAKVEPGNQASLRVATRSGLRREGVRRVAPGTGDREATTEYVVLARLATDPPLTEPEAFRALLNSFLPRKRAIGQMFIRDTDGRVLLCQLTYKRDWDLPGGVVEVGESPRLAVGARGRRGARPPARGRRPAAHRLAAAVGRLGRRRLPGLRRRRARARDRGPHRGAGAGDPHRGVGHARGRARPVRGLHRAPDRGGAPQPRDRRARLHGVRPMTDQVPTLYDWCGGSDALHRLTDVFYDRVLADPVLEPVFRHMGRDHRHHVAQWLGEVFGGPADYTEHLGGYPAMLRHHLGLAITEEQRSRWAALIAASADEAGLPADPEFRSAFVAYVEWGTRIAMANSVPGATPPPVLPTPRWGWGEAPPYEG